jgi:hypothetical protein
MNSSWDMDEKASENIRRLWYQKCERQFWAAVNFGELNVLSPHHFSEQFWGIKFIRIEKDMWSKWMPFTECYARFSMPRCPTAFQIQRFEMQWWGPCICKEVGASASWVVLSNPTTRRYSDIWHHSMLSLATYPFPNPRVKSISWSVTRRLPRPWTPFRSLSIVGRPTNLCSKDFEDDERTEPLTRLPSVESLETYSRHEYSLSGDNQKVPTNSRINAHAQILRDLREQRRTL